MRKESFLKKIGHILWPLSIYIVAQNVIAVLGMLLFKVEAGLWFVLLAACICIPIYVGFYRNDRKMAGEEKEYCAITNTDLAAILISGAALALALNNIIALTPLPIWFPGFEATNEVIFSGGLWMQILSAGVFGCIVEEVSMRGVTYRRIKRYWGKKPAMIWSAVIFGVYHFNVVQAVYAFFMGLFFVWVYERYKSLWAPILAHMSANIFVLMLSESKVAVKVMSSLVGFCLITCVSLLAFFYGWRYMKQSKQLTELEIVEKEPDTLEGLLEEYRHQEREEK